MRHNTRVLRVQVIGDDHVRVTTEQSVVDARRVVVTVGAWTTGLLGDQVALPRLVVTQEQPAHFALRDSSPEALARAATHWPGFNHNLDRRAEGSARWYSPVYGMYTPGQGVKAGWHGAGPIVDPDARSFQPERVQLAALQRYVREWLPGADADAIEPISCTYTTTANEDFVLDRVGPVVVGAGFSGHGFKFTPTIGRILADLATDAAQPLLPDLTKFALNRA